MASAARGTWANFVRNDQKQSYSQFHPPPSSSWAFLIITHHESIKIKTMKKTMKTMKTKTKTTTMKTMKTTMVKTMTIKWLETMLHPISFLPLPITSSSKTLDVLVTGRDIFHLEPFLLTKLENLKIWKPLMEFFAWLWVEENVKDLGRHWEVLKDIPGLQLTLWSNPFVSTSTSPSLGEFIDLLKTLWDLEI